MSNHNDLIRAIGVQNDCINDLRDEIERLREALLEAREALFNAGLDADWSVVDDVRGALLDALSGKGE